MKQVAQKFVSLVFIVLSLSLSLSLSIKGAGCSITGGEISVCGQPALGESRLCLTRCHADPHAAPPFPATASDHVGPSWSSVPSAVCNCWVPEERHVLPRLLPCVWARHWPVWRVHGTGPVRASDGRLAAPWPTVHPRWAGWPRAVAHPLLQPNLPLQRELLRVQLRVLPAWLDRTYLQPTDQHR